MRSDSGEFHSLDVVPSIQRGNRISGVATLTRPFCKLILNFWRTDVAFDAVKQTPCAMRMPFFSSSFQFQNTPVINNCSMKRNFELGFFHKLILSLQDNGAGFIFYDIILSSQWQQIKKKIRRNYSHSILLLIQLI